MTMGTLAGHPTIPDTRPYLAHDHTWHTTRPDDDGCAHLPCHPPHLSLTCPSPALTCPRAARLTGARAPISYAGRDYLPDSDDEAWASHLGFGPFPRANSYARSRAPHISPPLPASPHISPPHSTHTHTRALTEAHPCLSRVPQITRTSPDRDESVQRLAARRWRALHP